MAKLHGLLAEFELPRGPGSQVDLAHRNLGCEAEFVRCHRAAGNNTLAPLLGNRLHNPAGLGRPHAKAALNGEHIKASPDAQQATSTGQTRQRLIHRCPVSEGNSSFADTGVPSGSRRTCANTLVARSSIICQKNIIVSDSFAGRIGKDDCWPGGV